MPSVPFRAGVATSHHGRRITLSAEQISVLKQFIAESPAKEEEDD
jgi:hypothetical protein